MLPAPWSHGNPVDVLGDADPARYASSLQICLADPQIDAVLAVLTPQAMTEPVAVAEQVASIAKKSHKPVLVVWMGGAQIEPARQVFREAVVPNYRTPDTAVECIASIVAHYENQQLLLQAPPRSRTHSAGRGRGEGDHRARPRLEPNFADHRGVEGGPGRLPHPDPA
ncbi:MAG: hypothetical protein R2748_17555 [Bryobacterales bacterium]